MSVQPNDQPDQNDTVDEDQPAPAAGGQTDGDTDGDPGRNRADADKIAKTNRENAALRRRLKELEDRDKTDLQRAQESAQAAATRAATAERELLRLRIAAEHELTASDARRLIGDTEDELRADAVNFAAEKRQATTPAAATRRPTEDLRGGSQPDEPVVELDPIKLAEQIRSAR